MDEVRGMKPRTLAKRWLGEGVELEKYVVDTL